jgi:hypothetical protein
MVLQKCAKNYENLHREVKTENMRLIKNGCLKFDQQILFVWSAKLFF